MNFGTKKSGNLATMPARPPAPAKLDVSLHPAAQQAAAQWSNMLEENDRLRDRLQQTENDLEVSRNLTLEMERLLNEARKDVTEISTRAEERIAESERFCNDRISKLETNLERYRRYCVQITTKIGIASQQIISAHDDAMAVANEVVPKRTQQSAKEIEKEIESLVSSLNDATIGPASEDPGLPEPSPEKIPSVVTKGPAIPDKP